VEEARAGATLERAAAQYDAENFLESKLGIKSGWDLLPEEINSVKRPNRLDWSFTWEKHGFRAKDAPYRLNVVLQGDQIGNSEEYLKVPEAWKRSYKQLRSTNLLYNQIAIIPYVLLMGSALWLGISLWRQGQADWMGAIMLGALVAALYFFMQINQWQSTRANYDTHASYGSFVALQILLNILLAIGTALTVTMVLPGAVSRDAARPLAAQPGIYFARAAIQGIFFRGGGGFVAGGGAHRFYCGVLYVWQQSGRLGATGSQLFGCGEHVFSMDRGGRDRLAGVDQRRISLPFVCHTFRGPFDQIARAGNYSAGVFVELPAQRVSTGTWLHARN
jgi:hypothetical protein